MLLFSLPKIIVATLSWTNWARNLEAKERPHLFKFSHFYNMSLKTIKWYRSPPCASLLREEFPCQGVRNLKKTLPKALRTHTLTAFTSNSSLVWFGLVGMVWLVWFGRFGKFGLVGLLSSRFFDILNSKIYDLKRSLHLRCLLDPVLHSSSDNLVISISLCCCCYCWGLWAHGFSPLYKSNCLTVQTPSP